MKVGQYSIFANRGSWFIRVCDGISLNPDGSLHYSFSEATHERCYDYRNRDEALKRAYELNGWRWPPRPRTR